jgi:hypothetical protein
MWYNECLLAENVVDKVGLSTKCLFVTISKKKGDCDFLLRRSVDAMELPHPGNASPQFTYLSLCQFHLPCRLHHSMGSLPCLCCHVDCSLQLVAGNDVDGIEMLVM